MKKYLKKLTVLAAAVIMVLAFTVAAYAAECGTEYPFGLYEPNVFEFAGGTGKTTITCEKVHVTNGAKAEIQFSSGKYTKVEVAGVEYTPTEQTSSTTSFTIPVTLTEPTVIKATTMAMTSPQTIEYTLTTTLDKDNLKPVERKLQDGFYTTEVNTNKAFYGYTGSGESITRGFSYPKSDYSFPVTIEVKDGKIVDVAYTRSVNELVANTSSDINYLMWAMDGHLVGADTNYAYLQSSYKKYNLNPYPACNGTGMKEQIVEKNGVNGVDTVTSATISSRAIIDAVDQNMDKAVAGAKDEPAPVLPAGDTTDDIIPADGFYKVSGEDVDVIGSSLDSTKDILLQVKDGKMSIKALYLEQRASSYPYIYPGTEKDALDAGEAGWLHPSDYAYNYKYFGSVYDDVAFKSLDKPVNIMMFAGGSKNWFNRQFTIKAENVTAICDEEAAVMMAETELAKILVEGTETNAATNAKKAEAMEALAEARAALVAKLNADKDSQNNEIQEALKAELEAQKAELEAQKAEIEKLNKKNNETQAELKEAKLKAEKLTVQSKKVSNVKVVAGTKKATISWKSLGKGYSYQVYVSTKAKSGFKKVGTATSASFTAKNLTSKKTIYVKVRGFKKVDGKNVYTAYSNVVSKKIK